MAGFTPAFQIDDSTILFRLHKAAEVAAKKVGLKDRAEITNDGIVNDDPKASFKSKDFKYALSIMTKMNLKTLDGTMKFMASQGWLADENALKKRFGDDAFSSDDHGNISTVKKLKKDAFETMVAYFKTFAGEAQAKKLKEDDLKFCWNYKGDVFKSGKAVDEEASIGFGVGYSVGLTTQEA